MVHITYDAGSCFGAIIRKLLDVIDATSASKDNASSLAAIYALRGIKVNVCVLQ